MQQTLICMPPPFQGLAPMKFFIPPPAPLGTIPDSETETDPPEKLTSSTDPSEPPPGQSRDPPSTSGPQIGESSKPPLPHGHRRSHSSETSGHPPLYPHTNSGGGSHSAGGSGSPKKAPARTSSQPPPTSFFIPGPPVLGSSPSLDSSPVLGDAGLQIANGGQYNLAVGQGGESEKWGAETQAGYGGLKESQHSWQPPQGHPTNSSAGILPPPDFGSVSNLQVPGGVGPSDVPSGSLSNDVNAFYNDLSSAGVAIGSGEPHGKGFEVEEMTEVEL